MLAMTRSDLNAEIKSGIGSMHFELVCDAYYTQFLTPKIVEKAKPFLNDKLLNDAPFLFTQSAAHKIALDLLATKINRLVDRRAVKQAGDIASLEFLVNVAKSAVVYLHDTME